MSRGTVTIVYDHNNGLREILMKVLRENFRVYYEGNDLYITPKVFKNEKKEKME